MGTVKGSPTISIRLFVLLLSTLFPFSALGIFWGFSRGLISSHNPKMGHLRNEEAS